MQLWATIVNHSPINVHVERVTLCGSETAINYPLAPNQRRDFMVYTGAKPTSPHDRYSELYYKDRGTGEEFVCRHMVMFKDDQDGTFSPKGFSPLIVINSQRPASL